MGSARYMIIGGGGMLGRELSREVVRRQVPNVVFDDATDLDITEEAAVHAAVSAHRPDVVINAAAYTQVDDAEADPVAAMVNGTGPRNIGRACAEVGAVLVHYSTDYVFDGQFDQPCTVDAEPNPINAYGRSKLAGERALCESGCEHLVIRTSWLFAPHGRNFVLTMLKNAEERDSVTVVDDQFGRPTLSADLAAMTFELLGAGARGVVHAANDGWCSWFEFAKAIFDEAGIGIRVEPCSSDEFPRPARRPRYTVLDLTSTVALIGAPRHWEEALRDCLSVLGRTSTNRP